MTLAELEDKYGHLIQGEKSFRNTGYGRVLTGGLTPEQYNYIIRRYEYLVARGDMDKAELDRLETMFANLRPEDKAKLDAMTLPELMEQDRLLFFGRQGLEFDYLFGSAADKARIDYSKLRFEELMDQEVIDWRDPQYMEKLNAYVNETGLDPRTGREASDDVKFVAEHYSWVKSSSTLVASIADGVIDYSDLFKFKGLKETPSERVEIPDPPVNSQRERILKNIEESRKAREASKFDDYLRKEYQANNRYFPERITLPNGKKGYLSADSFEGEQVPVRSRDFVDADGHIKWPKKGDGFVLDDSGNPITEPANLKAGQFIDRYGNSGGRFTSPLENGQKLPFESRGLPYPEGYQPYHKYEVVVDLTEENIMKAYNEAPQIIQEKIKSSLNYYGLDIDELINIRRGEIAKVFGQGGGTQIQFGSSINYYEDLGLIREVQ